MALAERRAEVRWNGNLTEGSGTITEVGSGAFGQLQVSWKARTEEPGGSTSPEELIAAAHAACYAMALSNTLNKNGTPPEHLHVSATCSLDRVEGGVKITTMDLRVRARVSGLSADEFERVARQGEQGCPVSNALRDNVDIRLHAELEG